MGRFDRTELILGREAMDKLAASRVAVFGIGGVGGHAAEALVRSGIGEIDIIDKDTVDITNLNRQLVALDSTVGRFKTEVMKERMLDINPAVKVNEHRCFFLPETSSEFDFSRYDYVVDAVDTVTAKIELVMACNAVGTPIISSMGAGNKLHPEMFKIADIYKTAVCPLAKVMRRELKARGIKHLKCIYSEEVPMEHSASGEGNEERRIPGSIAFVPSAAGLIIAGAVVRDLLNIP